MNKKSVLAKRWLGVAAGSAIAMSASVAQATIGETESNDTFATANYGGTNNIAGSIGDASAASNDVDIFSFELLAGQTFTSSITYTGLFNPMDVNPVITLYKEDGGNYFPVASSDPQSMGNSLSFTPWMSGDYFMSVTADFNQGTDAFGNMLSDAMWMSDEFTTGTSWDAFKGESFTSFNYDVATTGAVPVPAAVWLFGSGLLGLVGAARRRSNKA